VNDVEGAPSKAQSLEGAASGGAAHVLVATSQVAPPTQSLELAQVGLHAPNAGSQPYGAQSNAVAVLTGHDIPAATQNAGP
jgi:hypothetical protein